MLWKISVINIWVRTSFLFRKRISIYRVGIERNNSARTSSWPNTFLMLAHSLRRRPASGQARVFAGMELIGLEYTVCRVSHVGCINLSNRRRQAYIGLTLTTLKYFYINDEYEWILLYVAFCTIMEISRQKEARSRVYMPYSYFKWLQGFFIVHSTIGSTVHSMPLNSLEHCICTTTMTNIHPARDSNLVPPGYKPQQIWMRNRGRLYKPWKQKGFFQFEISINILVSSFRFIWIPMTAITHFSALSVQGWTLDVRIWRLQTSDSDV